MRQLKISTGGQVSIPAEVRRRWATRTLTFEDQGDRLVLRPAPDDPVATARGALAGEISSSKALRQRAREDERETETRRS